jgi:hypothetical protein
MIDEPVSHSEPRTPRGTSLDDKVEVEVGRVEKTMKCGEASLTNQKLTVSLADACRKAFSSADSCEYVERRIEPELEPADKPEVVGYSVPERLDPATATLTIKYWLKPHEDCVKGTDGRWSGSESSLKLSVFLKVKPKEAPPAEPPARGVKPRKPNKPSTSPR